MAERLVYCTLKRAHHPEADIGPEHTYSMLICEDNGMYQISQLDLTHGKPWGESLPCFVRHSFDAALAVAHA